MARHTEASVNLIVLVLLVSLCCSCNAGKILVVYTVSPRCFGSHVSLGAAGTGMCYCPPSLPFTFRWWSTHVSRISDGSLVFQWVPPAKGGFAPHECKESRG